MNESTKAIGFYHSADFDGHCSGAILKLKWPDMDVRPYNYGEELPVDEIEDNFDAAYMVDVSAPREQMIELNQKTHFVWVDHHISKINELNDVYIKGLRRDGTAACELCWEYFIGDPMPYAVQLLGAYDVWDLERHKDVVPFQWGMRAETDTHPGSPIWDVLFSDNGKMASKVIADRGSTIKKFVDIDEAKAMKSMAFETEFDGLRALAINRQGNSMMFDSLWDPKRHDVMIPFYMTRDGQWRFSLFTYKPEIDLSEIAVERGKKYGTTGGGHKNAAGFMTMKLPEEFLRRS